MSRFDHRNEETFKKDIYFATHLEKYFFNKWMGVCESNDSIVIENPKDNGVDNDGGFIKSGATAGADYMVDIRYSGFEIKDMPLEIKWVPTHGKLTLKIGDLKAYARENAAILFIYQSEKTIDLKKPNDYDLTKHTQKIESISQNLRWGIMMPSKVKFLLEFAEQNGLIYQIPYMGNKPGIVLKQQDFKKFFKEERWT